MLILTHAQCKIADNGTPNLCNNWSGSKLFINLKHPVVERFRARFLTMDDSFLLENRAILRAMAELG